MRRLPSVSALVAIAAMGAGCSFLVSTSGLQGDPVADDAGPTPSPAMPEASTTDAPVPPGADAGVDAMPPPDPSLVGAWSFDETTGRSSADRTPAGHAAALIGGAVFDPGGVMGGCVRFDGTGKVHVDELGGVFFPKEGTLSMWVQYTFPENDGTGDKNFFDGWDNTRNHVFFRHADGSSELQVAFQPATSSYAFGKTFKVPKGQWSHVVITWKSGPMNGGEGAVIVDRVEMARSSFASAFEPKDQDFGFGAAWIGAVDEVKLWSRAFSRDEAIDLR